MRHFPLRECGYAVGFVVVLTASYVGAYYATVERVVNMKGRFDSSFDLAMHDCRGYVHWSTGVVRPFFNPIHDVD